MKHLTKMKSWTISLFAVMVLCSNAVQVEAYTDLNGYPFVVDNFMLQGYQYDNNNNSLGYPRFYGQLMEQNSYYFQIDSTYNYIKSMAFGNENSSLVVPINLDAYDYYVVGTFFSSAGGWTSSNLGSPSAYFYGTPKGGTSYERVYAPLTSFHYIDFVNSSGDGFSFYGNIDIANFSNLSYLRFEFNDNNLSLSGDCWFSASIVPVAKGSEAEQLNQSILNELIKINQNLVTSNSLQQSTIDAINQHDANEKSWFQQLIQNMGFGFSALYNQMTEEQDEQLNGFDSTTGDSNNQELSDNLGQVENVESALTTDAFDGMNNYTITNDIMGYDAQFATAFPIVASMIQSVFDSSGEFGIILSVTFTVIIASMLIGLYRYYKE